MNSAKVYLIAGALVLVVICSLSQLAEAGEKEKGDLIIMGVGGGHGCGPMVLKTGGKKDKGGDLLVMNPCNKKKKTKYIPYPVIHKEESYETHESYPVEHKEESYETHEYEAHDGDYHDGY